MYDSHEMLLVKQGRKGQGQQHCYLVPRFRVAVVDHVFEESLESVDEPGRGSGIDE